MSSAAAGTATVQISLDTRDQIRDRATHIGKSMQAVVEEAIDLYRRHCFLKEVNVAYADLREDPQATSNWICFRFARGTLFLTRRISMPTT
jgi:hypothetical protein